MNAGVYAQGGELARLALTRKATAARGLELDAIRRVERVVHTPEARRIIAPTRRTR
jgi:hypothetical protein